MCSFGRDSEMTTKTDFGLSVRSGLQYRFYPFRTVRLPPTTRRDAV